MGQVKIVDCRLNAYRICSLYKVKVQRCSAVLLGGTVGCIIRIFNRRSGCCRVIRVRPVSLIKTIVVHQRIILDMERTRFPENINIA